MMKLRALSIRQPWAWLVANGHKDIENRCWPTTFRGRFLIHAGRRWGADEKLDLYGLRAECPEIQIPDALDLGGIVGVAEIVDCVTEHPSRWFGGEFGFVIANARPLPFTPCHGLLNFFAPQLDAAAWEALDL